MSHPINQSSDQSFDRPSTRSGQRSTGRRAARGSLVLLLGLPIGIALTEIWGRYVDISPTVDDADRVRGWESVVRGLPASVVFLAFFAGGFALAVRAVRHGAVGAGLRAIWWHGAALFLALLILLGGSAENVMTTRPATVKWVLFPIEVGIAVGAVAISRHAAGHPLGRRRSN